MNPEPGRKFIHWATRILPIAVAVTLLLGGALWGLSSDDGTDLKGRTTKMGRLSPTPTPPPHPAPCNPFGCAVTGPSVTDDYAKSHLLTFAELRRNADIRYERPASKTNALPPKSNDYLPACDWSQKPLASNHLPGHTTYNRYFNSYWWQYPQWASTPKDRPPRYRFVENVMTYTDLLQEVTDWATFKNMTCKRPAPTKAGTLAGWQMFRRSQTIHCLNIHWHTSYCSLYEDYFMRGNVIIALEWSEAPDDHHHAQHTADHLDNVILGKFNKGMPTP
ncbi:hypothetical protein [Actinomadura rupiterrae]|uniref:hypothetical protein n=1 Tax=Actinomadura rupiterrae TaxID=559627 RepID=UPI0020A35B7B|nr:hypothetical protein [Actinomadura rupiterrae]MCP2341628.1 hypothetical protein [Actinomadura rupiterrae]